MSELASEPVARLRGEAEALSGPLPPLLAAADHLASAVLLGSHGRRRVGIGDEFWQYRPSVPGDELRLIDWRRSGRSDAHFVREREWQAAQSVAFWVDAAQSMAFASRPTLPQKGERARAIAMAAAILLVRAGERVGLAGLGLPPRAGELQLLRLATALLDAHEAPDYGAPEVAGMLPHTRAVFVSDFLGPMGAVEKALTGAADRGVTGAILQILDPQEEAFPFDGRTIFESAGGSLRHETLKAGDLRGRYLERLAERKLALQTLAQRTGWLYECHHTDSSASAALLWLYGALQHGYGC